MTGLGWKAWTTETLSAPEVQGYFMDQAVMRFVSASARDATIASPTDGMVSYLEDVDEFHFHEGGGSGFWRPLGPRWPNHSGAASALPTTAAGVRPGDFLYSSSYECPMIYVPGGWRQLSPAIVDGISAYKTRLAAAGITSLHNGFMVMQSVTNRLYTCIGGTDLMLVAGGSYARESPPTSGGLGDWGTGTAGWSLTVAGGATWVRNVGQGFAQVNVEFTRTGAAVTPGTGGDLANTTMTSVPSLYVPMDVTPLTNTGVGRPASGYIGTSGQVVLTGSGAGAIATGEAMSLAGLYRLATLSE